MVVQYTPDKGDIVWLNFSPQEGHEQAGNRPALILSPESYNRNSQLTLACPITSKIKGYPFEVRIKTSKIDGVILADQIKNLDWNARKIEFVEKAPYEIVEETWELIQSLLEN
jgi:mRNA interferase MazF